MQNLKLGASQHRNLYFMAHELLGLTGATAELESYSELTCAEALHITRFMLVEANPHAFCLILNLYYHFNVSCIIWQETLKWCCMETTQVPL